MRAQQQKKKQNIKVGLAREVARNERAAQGYVGALTKNGSGTLTLTGNNSFTGAITVNEGQLSGLNQSLGSSTTSYRKTRCNIGSVTESGNH